MKLYIVRHCERYSSPLYKSQLTEKGKLDATKLSVILYENNMVINIYKIIMHMRNIINNTTTYVLRLRRRSR